MAEQILFDDLYNQLTPEERNEYGGYKIARGLGGEEDANTMAEGTNFQEIFDAQQAAKATKPSAWNPLNWIFSPAASSEMPQKYGLQTNTMGGVTLNPDGSLNYNNQSPNLGFRSMVDMAADTENFDNQFNNNFADAEMTAPFYNTMRGSVIGQDMDIRDYQQAANRYSGMGQVGPNKSDMIGTTIDEDRIPGRVQESVPNYQNWFERMMSGAQNKLGGAWGKTKELGSRFKEGAGPVFGLASMFANATNPLNPNSFNFNPALSGQLGTYDEDWDISDSGKALSGPLAGQNLISGFGTNDVTAMLRKRLARIRNRKIAQTDSSKAKQQKILDAIKTQTAAENAGYTGTPGGNVGSGVFAKFDQSGKTYGPYSGQGGNQGSNKSVAKGTGASGPPGRNYKAYGGRVGYGNGGLATLFTRRG